MPPIPYQNVSDVILRVAFNSYVLPFEKTHSVDRVSLRKSVVASEPLKSAFDKKRIFNSALVELQNRNLMYVAVDGTLVFHAHSDYISKRLLTPTSGVSSTFREFEYEPSELTLYHHVQVMAGNATYTDPKQQRVPHGTPAHIRPDCQRY